MSLFTELKRRNVIKVAMFYGIGSWLIIQVAETVLPLFAVPDSLLRGLVILLAIGLLPVLAFSWIYQMTPEGIKKESEIVAGQSVTTETGQKLNIAILVLLVLAVGLMAYQQFSRRPDTSQTPQTAKPAQNPREATDAPDRSIAVLPFTNRSAELDTGYFVDGIHDDLLTQLARIGELKVISRTSVMEYRDTTKNLRQIGKELGVATIMEGAVQRAGDRVRINAQLIDAASDEHLWAQTFDKKLSTENIFEVQSEIAHSIASALQATMSPQAEAGIGALPTQSQAAYDLYLRALSRPVVGDESSFRKAIGWLHQALALDPDFALAKAELGYLHTEAYWYFARDPADLAEAGRWIESARALAPDEPRVVLRWAIYLYHGRIDFPAALGALDQAIALLPNSSLPLTMRAYIRRRQGRFDEALADLYHAAILNPRDGEIAGELSTTYAFVLDLPNARRWQQTAQALEPDGFYTILNLALLDGGLLGDYRPLLAALARLPAKPVNNDYLLLEQQALRLLRDYPAALSQLDRWLVDPAVNQDTLEPVSLARARVLSAMGEEDQARSLALATFEVINGFLAGQPGDWRGLSARAEALAISGQSEAALQTSAQVLATPAVAQDALLTSANTLRDVLLRARLLDSPAVAAALDHALSMPGAGATYKAFVMDPVFDRHLKHPAFVALAKKYAHQLETAP